MNYDHYKLLADFANRTLHNLQLIREIQKTQPERKAYEVTQLINSLLGLLVFPKERYLDDIPDKTLDELKDEGWPIPDVRPGYIQAQNLRDFLRLMRNAIAHFNVEFLPDQANEIIGVKVWNKRNGVKTWEVELTLEQIEAIALRFIGLLTGQSEMNNQTLQLFDVDTTLSAPIEWKRAFIRSGFSFQTDGESFDFSQENGANQQFLMLILEQLGQHQHFNDYVFSPSAPIVDETAWLGVIEKLHTGSEGGPSDMQNIELQIMDTYMAGIIRWINAAGFKTTFSCDGHEEREPRLLLQERDYTPLLDFCFRMISGGKWEFAHNRPFKRGSLPNRNASAMQPYNRSWLLDVAEEIYQHHDSIHELVKSAEQVAHSPALRKH